MKIIENEPRSDAEIYEKSIRFQNPRFLDFYEEYNVKTVLSHDPMCWECVKNQTKTHVKCDA